MNIDQQNFPTDLIAKYLAGEANAEEAMLMDDWLADPVNKKEFEKFSKLWSQFSDTSNPVIPSKADTWIEIQSATKKEQPAKVRKLNFYHYVSAACIIGLIIFSTLTFFDNDQNSKSKFITLASTSEIKTDTIPDGSFITLNKNSSVIYKDDFNQERRELELKGEAFFDVAPDKSKPFIITIDDLKVEVVGTSFNIHRFDDRIEVQVKTGTVKMYVDGEEIFVTKGQTGIYTKSGKKLSMKDSLDLNSLSYATKSFYFQDISLAEACEYLEHAFNVTISLDKVKFADCRFTAKFESKPLNYILDIISATLNINYKISGKTVSLNGEGCK